jgi:hypothetical protein
LHSRITVETQGAVGETAAAALARIKSELAGDPPAFAILRIGADDALQKTPPPKFEASLREGVSLLRAAGVEMEVVGLPMADGMASTSHGDIAAVLEKIAREQTLPFVNRATMLKNIVLADGRERQMSDGGWSLDDFGGGCLPEQAARPIVDGIRATH